MKKVQSLGRKLSKDEQRKIAGGYVKIICTCNNCDLETVVCAVNSFEGGLKCVHTASDYCRSVGCSTGTTCDVSGPH